MPQSITSNQVLLAQQTLKSLLLQFPMLTKIATNFSANYRYGDTVRIPLVSATAAIPYDPAVGYASIDQTVAAVDVPITTHIHHTYELNPLEYSTVNPATIDRLSIASAHSIGKAIMDAIVAKVTVANFQHETVASTLDFNTIVSADQKLAERGTPDPKYILLNGTAFAEALKDETIHSGLVNWNKGANAVVSTGIVGDILGMPAMRYAGMANNSETLKGWLANSDAVCIAVGLPAEAETQAVNRVVVTDEESGLSCVTREFVDQRKGSYVRTVTLAYGLKEGLTGALQRIVGTQQESSSEE